MESDALVDARDAAHIRTEFGEDKSDLEIVECLDRSIYLGIKAVWRRLR